MDRPQGAGTKLTAEHRQILAYLARLSADDSTESASWIAEGCGHFYDTPWASGRLPGLLKRGLVEKAAKGWYRITPAGRTALQEEGAS